MTFKQKRGTEIGTKLAPPYSFLSKAELEEAIRRKPNFKPYLQWSYVDDIFFLYGNGEEKLTSLINDSNKISPTIKFTAEWWRASNFLDVSVPIAEGIIETDLHAKPTKSHQYLLSPSYDPFYYNKGMPYSHTLRVNIICSNNEFFNNRYKD